MKILIQNEVVFICLRPGHDTELASERVAYNSRSNILDNPSKPCAHVWETKCHHKKQCRRETLINNPLKMMINFDNHVHLGRKILKYIQRDLFIFRSWLIFLYVIKSCPNSLNHKKFHLIQSVE